MNKEKIDKVKSDFIAEVFYELLTDGNDQEQFEYLFDKFCREVGLDENGTLS